MTSPIQRMYTEVPRTYEILNHLLTLGQDIRWRRQAARVAAAAGGVRWLDAGTGTGEMAANLRHLASDDTRIVACDFSLPMMQKARDKPETGFDFALGEATRLPLASDSFDAITLSFAARNIDSSGRGNLLKCFAEFQRILKPGGRFVNLETSQPKNRSIRGIYHFYVKLAVRPVGRLVSGSDTAYNYLARSMVRFHGAEELSAIIREAGFQDIEYRPLLLGAAAIHTATKPVASHQPM